MVHKKIIKINIIQASDNKKGGGGGPCNGPPWPPAGPRVEERAGLARGRLRTNPVSGGAGDRSSGAGLQTRKPASSR